MTNPLVRGVPVQDLPENQDPSVRWTLNEVTGEITPWDDVVETGEEKPKKRRTAKSAAPADAAESGDAGGKTPVEVAATSARELGS